MELAGEIETVGKNVSLFRPGDNVFASTELNFRTYAQYTCIPEKGLIARLPTNVTYDIIFDAVGKLSASQCKKSLKKNGIYLNVLTSSTGLKLKSEELLFLKELLEAEKLRSVIDKTYTLEQIVEAHRYVDKGHKKGNVVITVEHNDSFQ